MRASCAAQRAETPRSCPAGPHFQIARAGWGTLPPSAECRRDACVVLVLVAAWGHGCLRGGPVRTLTALAMLWDAQEPCLVLDFSELRLWTTDRENDSITLTFQREERDTEPRAVVLITPSVRETPSVCPCLLWPGMCSDSCATLFGVHLPSRKRFEVEICDGVSVRVCCVRVACCPSLCASSPARRGLPRNHHHHAEAVSVSCPGRYSRAVGPPVAVV